jgi:hypothetical protein
VLNQAGGRARCVNPIPLGTVELREWLTAQPSSAVQPGSGPVQGSWQAFSTIDHFSCCQKTRGANGGKGRRDLAGTLEENK